AAGSAGLAAVAAAQAAAPKPAVPNPARGSGPYGGIGACSKCNCRHFEGSGCTCANAGCGHAYRDHL
ncbi:MAG TPA: hypothetical protein VMS17_09145, partial [Gemmataceae bacterium]|nr:hypothetical protein [Gemmataceae bacterium]